MSKPVAKTEENQKLYEELNKILPRYVRFSSQHNQNQVNSYLKSLDPSIISKSNPCQSDSVGHQLHFLSKTLGEWYALPGGVELGSFRPIENGMYPMDISSALPVIIFQDLLLNSCTRKQSRSLKILDLCCSPGSKFQLISDSIHNLHKLNSIASDNKNHINGSHTKEISSFLMVGVDVSLDRLNVCKSLIHKWKPWSALQAIESIARSGCNSGNNSSSSSSCNGSNSSNSDNSSKLNSTKYRQMLFHADGTTFGRHNIGHLIYDSRLWELELVERMYHGSVKSSNSSNTMCNTNMTGRDNDAIQEVSKTNHLLSSSSSSSSYSSSTSDSSAIRRSDSVRAGDCDNQLKPRFSKRKRMNKSALHREKQRLNQLEDVIKNANRSRNNNDNNRDNDSISNDKWDNINNNNNDNNSDNNNNSDNYNSNNNNDDDDDDDLSMGDFDFVFVDAECTHTGSYRHMAFISDDNSSSNSNNTSSSNNNNNNSSNDSSSSNNNNNDNNNNNNDNNNNDNYRCRESETNTITTTSATTSTCIITTTATTPTATTSATTTTTTTAASISSTAATTPFQKPKATQKFQSHQSDPSSLQTLQRQLILNGYHSLKLNGYLIYSTCSVSDLENEDIVQWLVDECNDWNHQPSKPVLIPCPLSIIQYEQPPSSSSLPSSSSSSSSSSSQSIQTVTEPMSSNIHHHHHAMNYQSLDHHTISNVSNDDDCFKMNIDMYTVEMVHQLLYLNDKDFNQFISHKLFIEKRQQQQQQKQQKIVVPELLLPTVDNKNFDLLFYQRLSNRICQYIAHQKHFPVQKGKLPGTLKCSRNVGMSGLFIAIIQKVSVS